MAKFETNRLIARSLSLEEYAAFENDVEPQWSDCTNPYKHLITGPNPIPHRIRRIKVNPDFAEIGLFLGITKDKKEIVGSTGFHDFPDERGMIEIGFSIMDQVQRQGYGVELLLGAWKWILDFPGVEILRYTVSPSNDASMHIITILGFALVGEQMDEEDGLELIYEMSTEEFKEKFVF